MFATAQTVRIKRAFLVRALHGSQVLWHFLRWDVWLQQCS